MSAAPLRRTTLVTLVTGALALLSAKTLFAALEWSLGGEIVLIAGAVLLTCLATCTVSVLLGRRTQHHHTDDVAMSSRRRVAR